MAEWAEGLERSAAALRDRAQSLLFWPKKRTIIYLDDGSKVVFEPAPPTAKTDALEFLNSAHLLEVSARRWAELGSKMSAERW